MKALYAKIGELLEKKPDGRPHSGKSLNPPNFGIIACIERPTNALCFMANRSNVRQRIHLGLPLRRSECPAPSLDAPEAYQPAL